MVQKGLHLKGSWIFFPLPSSKPPLIQTIRLGLITTFNKDGKTTNREGLMCAKMTLGSNMAQGLVGCDRKRQHC